MGRRQRGSILKEKRRLPDGTIGESLNYCIVFRDVRGKQVKITVGPRKKDAVRLLDEKLGAIQTGAYRELKRATFRQYAEGWIAGRAALKPSTRACYEAILGVQAVPRPAAGSVRRRRAAPAHQLVTVFGDRALDTIEVSDVNRYLAEHTAELRPKTRRNILSLFQKILDDAVEEGYLPVNRLRGSKTLQRPRALRPEDAETIEILDPAEVNQLLDAMPAEPYPFFLTLALTGLRLGEALGLQWGDIERGAGRVHVRRTVYRGQSYVPKTKRSARAVDVGDQLLGVLDGVRLARFGDAPPPPDALMFPSAAGTPMDPDNLRHRVWEPALATAELRHVRIHSLRHTYASMLIAQGENLKYVSSQLGHSSITITVDRYGHLFRDEKRTAAGRLEAQLARGARGSNGAVTLGAEPAKTEPDGARTNAG
jgi:integrase